MGDETTEFIMRLYFTLWWFFMFVVFLSFSIIFSLVNNEMHGEWQTISHLPHIKIPEMAGVIEKCLKKCFQAIYDMLLQIFFFHFLFMLLHGCCALYVSSNSIMCTFLPSIANFSIVFMRIGGIICSVYS